MRKKRIGVMMGSFKPFHVGHLDIALKGQEMFDEFWIAFGTNPAKTYGENKFPDYDPLPKLKEMGFRIGLMGDKSAVDYVKQLSNIQGTTKHSVTIVKGLRDESDFRYELTQYRWIREMNPNISVATIFSDPDKTHVSSSGLRQMVVVNPEHAQTYLI